LTYAFNEKGEIILVDSYTDEHYDVSLSIDKDGSPKIERIYGNQRLSELQGALKQRITLSEPVVIFWCFNIEMCYGGT
jgi:hypothetical protein